MPTKAEDGNVSGHTALVEALIPSLAAICTYVGEFKKVMSSHDQ